MQDDDPQVEQSGREVTIFRANDAGYLAWIDEHADGWVINARATLDRSYLKMHRTSCLHISNPEVDPGGWTERDYIKVCGADAASLKRWAATRLGTEPELTCYCAAT